MVEVRVLEFGDPTPTSESAVEEKPVIAEEADAEASAWYEQYDYERDEIPNKFSWKHGYKTKNEYSLKEVVSALQKEIRRGNEREAFYWAHEMVVSGFAKYFWRRLLAICCEDIGLADMEAIQAINVFYKVFDVRTSSWTKGPFTMQAVGGAILAACRAKKSRETDMFSLMLAAHKEKFGWRMAVPEYALDNHTGRGKDFQDKMTRRERFLRWWRVGSYSNNVAPGNRYLDESVDFEVSKGKISQEEADEVKREQRKMYGLPGHVEHFKFDFSEPLPMVRVDWQKVFETEVSRRRKVLSARLRKKKEDAIDCAAAEGSEG